MDITPFSINMQNGTHIQSPSRSRSPSMLQSTPDQSNTSRPPPRRPSGLRKSSGLGALSREQSPAPANRDTSTLTENGDGSPSPSAASKVALGTSSRAIERVMAENDRLKRDLNAEIAHRQELEQSEEVSKGLIEKLRAENSNLVHTQETFDFSLKRKDRIITDLRAELEELRKTHRAQADELHEIRTDRADTVEQCRRETAQAKESEKHAVNIADVLETSHKLLAQDYAQRVESVKEMVVHVFDGRDIERGRIYKYEVVVEGMAHELEKSRKVIAKMDEEHTRFREHGEREITRLKEEAEASLAERTRIQEEALQALGAVKYYSNLFELRIPKSNEEHGSVDGESVIL